MNKTIIRRITVATDIPVGDAMLGLRQEFGLPYESKSRLGSLDSPNDIPAGSCVKYTDENCNDWVFQRTIQFRY